MKKIIIIVGVIILVGFGLLVYIGSPGSLVEDSYQADKDKVRIDDVHYIVQLVEDYKKSTGRYPLEDEYDKLHLLGDSELQKNKSTIPIISIIHKDDDFIASILEQLPYDFIEVHPASLNARLQEVLGGDVSLPTDPQTVGNSSRPNIYRYQFLNGEYVVTAHLYEQNGYSEKIDEYYYKYEVGTLNCNTSHIRCPEEI